MKGRINLVWVTLVATLAFCANTYAGCTNAQFAGIWDVAFSDGNACRLVLNKEGEVLIEDDRSQSTCFDPFRGTTVPNQGEYAVASDCSFEVKLVVEDVVNVEIYGRIAHPRNVAAGIFVTYIPEVFAEKGSANLIRVK